MGVISIDFVSGKGEGKLNDDSTDTKEKRESVKVARKESNPY